MNQFAKLTRGFIKEGIHDTKQFDHPFGPYHDHEKDTFSIRDPKYFFDGVDIILEGLLVFMSYEIKFKNRYTKNCSTEYYDISRRIYS